MRFFYKFSLVSLIGIFISIGQLFEKNNNLMSDIYFIKNILLIFETSVTFRGLKIDPTYTIFFFVSQWINSINIDFLHTTL